MNPDVLLLDEPTTGLDDESKKRISHVLEELPQAMIIVSHERDFVARLADRTLLMERGRLIDGD
jgi:cobalt/nickel transport system ATP-binding protein